MVARLGPVEYALVQAICLGRPGYARKNGWRLLISVAKSRWRSRCWPDKRGSAGGGRRPFQGETMSEIVTAGILVIGDEILSGRTKDKNIGFIAEYLTNIGIDLKEVRVVADEEAEIIAALDALRARYTYIFTTGGIGPTHDDITADTVAKAFGVSIDYHPQAVELMKARVAETGGVMNEARMRMTRVPAGAELVLNTVSAAPGFWIGNVIVMAGVPHIMQVMLDYVAPKLKTGVKMLSDSVRADCREGDIGTELGAVAKQHPDVVIGS